MGPAKGPGAFGWAQPKVQDLLARPSQRSRLFGLGPAKGPGACGWAQPKVQELLAGPSQKVP
eukprot:1307541-Alexandrium_andersonii.AAC.1